MPKKIKIQNELPDDYFKRVVFSIPGCLYWKNLQGRYLGANGYLLKLLGFNEYNELIGKTDHDFFTKEQADIIRANDLKVLETREAIYVQETISCANNETKTFISNKSPLFDDSGEIIGCVGNSLDVTELKNNELFLRAAKEKAEEESRTNAAYLKNVVACTPGNLFWKDRDGYWLGCNNFTLEVLKLQSEQDLKGKTDYDFFTKEEADQLRENDLEVMKSGKVLKREEIVTLPDGQVKIYAAVKMPLKDSQGKIMGIIGDSLDITELKETQKALLEAKEIAETANKTKDMFMENMSHDFKTPLNGIWGVVQILSTKKDELPEEIRELIEIQEKSVKRLRKMIESILDFNKIHAGKIQIEQEEFNLLDTIESIVHNISYQLKNKDINIIIDYPADVPRHIINDSHCVNSILLNLMSNAVKFTEKGYITISLKKISQKDKQANLQISVEDTGEGIPPNKLEEIFERFHRLELSNKGLKEGHGIGLSAVKELVDKLNGKIYVESHLKKGSTFTVTLPFEVTDTSIWISMWEKKYPTVSILLISDKRTSTDIFLSETNLVHKVDSFSAVQYLEDALQQQKPCHIIIIDDEIQGELLPFVQTIKMMSNIPAPMILLSIHPQKDKDRTWYDTARKAGCFDFIMKPVLPSELDKKIVETWEKWQKLNLQ